MTSFALIAAMARDGSIGQAGGLPWPMLRQDMAWFRLLTTAQSPHHMAIHLAYYPRTVAIAQSSLADTLRATDQNAVIMGRRTWESLPARTLPGRELYVLTHHPWTRLPDPWPAEVTAADSLPSAFRDATKERCPNVFVIGGAQVYAEALHHPDCQTLYLTEIEAEYPEADTHWPESRIDWEKGILTTWTKTCTPLHTISPGTTWSRTHVSAWITEPDRPRYRFGIWQPLT